MESFEQGAWAPLIEYKRKGLAEVTLHGTVSWATGERALYTVGTDRHCYGRSLMKPFQMKVFANDLGPELSLESQAVSVASHNGEPAHVAAVKAILKSADLNLVQNPESKPMRSAVSGANCAEVKAPERVFHPCSGKHAAIVKGCQLRGWPTSSYLSSGHPYHQAYLEVLRGALGETWTPKVTAVDGCGLPTVSMTVSEQAKLYASLAATRNQDWIWHAMVEKPELVGGTNRLDTLILKSCGGRVLAKEGADGLLGLSVVHEKFPKGLGIVIKVSHGWDAKAMHLVACRVLRSLGFEIAEPPAPDKQDVWVSPDVVLPELRVKV